MKLDTISFRDWKNVDVECFCNSLNLEEFDYDENIGLHEFWAQYDKRLNDQCKIFVPIKNKKIIKRGTKSWYDDKLREQEIYEEKKENLGQV